MTHQTFLASSESLPDQVRLPCLSYPSLVVYRTVIVPCHTIYPLCSSSQDLFIFQGQYYFFLMLSLRPR